MPRVGSILFASAWLASCQCGQESSSPQLPAAEAPNVLILLWDTVRADHMSLYGYDRATTPNLDALAATARVWEQAQSPGMWTVPAHGSLFTGLPVASHGANAKWLWLDQRFVTLAEQLGGHGYDTWAWSANPYLSPSTNLLQGFDSVHLAWDGPWSEASGRATMDKRIARDASVELGPAWDGQRGRGWPAQRVAYKDSAPVANEALLDWLDHRDSERPWLVYMNLLEAHHPRVPAEATRARVLDPETIEAGLATDGSLFRVMAAMEGQDPPSQAERAALGGVYDAALGDLDAALGALIGELTERGVLDDTVIVVVSDHGEHLGEHGMYDHRWSVYQELLHVPLVIRFPHSVPPGREARPVSTQQLFPTLCELAGTPCPQLPVSSLLGPPPERVFSELIQPTPRLKPVLQGVPVLDPARWRRRYHVVREGDLKLIRASDRAHALFDLGPDPGEEHSLWADRPEDGARLLEATRLWQERLVPYDAGQREPGDHPLPALEANPNTAEQLRLLGYTDGSEDE